MGCCFCCLNEGDKVGRVLEKFVPAPVSAAQDGTLQKLVGRVVLAGTAPFYTPGGQIPCVYYHVTVEEERVEWRKNADGRRERSTRWHTICTQARFADFYLQCGAHKLFINGSNRGQCRIQGHNSQGRSSFFSQPPIGIQQLIQQNCRGWCGWGAMDTRTGRFRYKEQSFNVNDLVAALGVVTPAVDPYTHQPCKVLNPIAENALNEQYFESHGWSKWDRRSWSDLVRNPAVLLSDHRKFTGSVQVAPVQNLPTYMMQYVAVPGGFPGVAPGMGGGMGPGMGAPGMGAPGMGAPGMGAPGMGAPSMGYQQQAVAQPVMQPLGAKAPLLANQYGT